ncbi:hypothetical protein GRF29_154g1148068 [Pseudopithomyces chartarum]|uniref:Uncharacterized protein n=1 Tax=Pseudopithomyces chartarum TaxID=1892770 RepID=A0AAN6LVE3_9PLEO|nr:hypothetical protein GRF29_154g1148068 [Pseudopithomyces chartarum]
MLRSPVSPESPEDRDRKHGARAFARIHNYEAGLEVAAHQHREKSDLDPVVVLNSPDTPVYDGHVVLIVLLIAAIVGGAVGGVMARKSTTSSSSNLSTSPSPTTTTTTTPSATPTDSSSPSPATQSPHVHFRFQTYEEQNMKGSTQLFVEPGLYRPGFPIKSYVWITAKDGDLLDPTPLLRCSVGFCKNSKLLGWRGASNMRQAGTSPSYDATANFIIIVCDLVYPEPDCRGKGFDEVDATRTVATVGIVETQGTENPEQELTDGGRRVGAGVGTGRRW